MRVPLPINNGLRITRRKLEHPRPTATDQEGRH